MRGKIQEVEDPRWDFDRHCCGESRVRGAESLNRTQTSFSESLRPRDGTKTTPGRALPTGGPGGQGGHSTGMYVKVKNERKEQAVGRLCLFPGMRHDALIDIKCHLGRSTGGQPLSWVNITLQAPREILIRAFLRCHQIFESPQVAPQQTVWPKLCSSCLLGSSWGNGLGFHIRGLTIINSGPHLAAKNYPGYFYSRSDRTGHLGNIHDSRNESALSSSPTVWDLWSHQSPCQILLHQTLKNQIKKSV